MQAIRSKDPQQDKANPRRFLRKVNPNSPPTTVEIHGVRVHFPFRPYGCQEAYMAKVMEALLRSENALLESPTGTGKTLCLLCACLAWQREQSRQISSLKDHPSIENKSLAKAKPSRVPVIVYASRTHSQLSQVVRELRNTRYRPSHAVLGSREQMCVNPKVKKATSSASDINHDCGKLAKERKCRFRNGLEGFTAPPNEEGSGDSNSPPVMDIEDLLTMGKEHKVCPFYYSRAQVERAELILIPYNYLFDKDARATTLSDVPWENAVVIFDEAHNLESFASESASFDLTTGDIAGCIAEVGKALNYIQTLPDVKSEFQLREENVLRVKAIFMNLEAYICNQIGPETAYAGEYMIEIFKKGACITYDNHSILIEEIRKINDLLLDMRGSTATRGSPKLEHFIHCLKRVFGHQLEAKCYAKAAFYRVHVSPKPTPTQKSRSISFWCFAPSLAMEEIAGLNVRSIVVTSGTLSPLPSYSMELGLHFAHMIENPHIIADEQIHVRIVGKGVTGKLLSSSFERRKDGEYFTELGNTIASLAKVIPAGILVFFPSYSVMETCIERWGGPASSGPAPGQGNASFFAARRTPVTTSKFSFPHAPSFYVDSKSPTTPWKRLLSTKAVVVEPKSSADLPDAIAEFKRYLGLQKSSGCILMGVCRGKLSEGIDFAHEQSRAVVITGLPFPPSHDAKVRMKREFLDGHLAARNAVARKDGGFGGTAQTLNSAPLQLSGVEWYTQQAHRAVNQAIGRVIRNVSDYGAVLLLDARFEQSNNQAGLSKWLRPHIQKDEGFGATIRALAAFYKDADKKAQETAAKLSPELLKLEDECLSSDDEDTLPSKVAVVRPTAKTTLLESESSMSSENDEPSSYVAPDRIIAKIDVKDVPKRPLSPAPSPRSEPTKKVKVSNDAVFNASSSTTTRPGKENPVAARFFERAQTLMSQKELLLTKAAIVSMRNNGLNKNTSGFNSAAGGLLNQIIRCDSLEHLEGKESDDNLLLLFLRLLPPAYLSEVSTMAMKYTFDSSVLCQICKGNLPPRCFSFLRSQMVSLLKEIWCVESSSSITDAEYLVKLEGVLRIILKIQKKGASFVLNALLKLVPGRYISKTRTMANEMITSWKIERVKAADKQKGEAKLPVEPHQDREKAAHSRTAPLKAPPTSSQALGQRELGAGHENGVPSIFKVEKTPERPLSKEQAQSERSLLSLIKKVETDTFVKQRLSGIANNISTCSSETLMCPVCSSAASEPYMADCGHTACLGCWKVWLARSESCPSCRVATSIESIARIVFENIPGQRVTKSLRELTKGDNRQQADECDDSEGQLEFF